jgi:hypothetical protein
MKAKFKSNHSFEDRKPNVGRQDAPKLTDMVEMLEWPKKGKSVQVRLVGPVVSRGLYKVNVRKKDGSETQITKVSLNYNPETDELDSTKKCPYSKLPKEMARFSKVYFVNAIVRPLQEDAPSKPKKPTKSEAESGFKEIDSDTWTPVRVIRIPSSLALRIKQLGEKNIVKDKNGNKKAFPATHEKYGFDLDLTFDKMLPPANMYSADRAESPNGDRYSPLSEEEQNYLLWNIEEVYLPEDFATAKKEAEGLEERWFGKSNKRNDEDDEDDDSEDDIEDDENEPKSKKSSKASTKSKKSDDLDDDDDEDDEDEDDMDLDAEEEEDDDLDDDEEDDEEDDDEPKSKSKGKKPVKSKSKSKKSDEDDEDDEEDDDLDDDDDEEDEDEPKSKKSSKKPAPKSKSKKSDEDDEDDEDEEDDDLDDLDEDDDEDDSDDEEEEKPKAKSKAKKPAVKPAAKKSSKR